MGAVKPISELTVAPDGCFAFVKKSSSIEIEFDTPGGKSYYLDFDAFAHSDGTILRFPSRPSENPIWSMNVVFDDGSKQLLQWNTYEDNNETWDLRYTHPHRFLGIMRSVNTQSDLIESSKRIVAIEDRCDLTSRFGPTMFSVPFNGIEPNFLDFDLVKNNFGGFHPVLSINGVAHITSQIVNKIDMSWRNWPIATYAAKTISGMIKQTVEWKELYVNNISEEEIAKTSSDFIDAIGITEEMIDELKTTEVIMPVERFMNGYGNPRHGFSETGVLPDSIKTHLRKQLRYSNLSSMEKLHPSHPKISDSLKDEELNYHKEAIFLFIIRTMPGIDPSIVTTKQIYDRVYYPTGRVIDEPRAFSNYFELEHQWVEQGLNAAKFFDAIS